MLHKTQNKKHIYIFQFERNHKFNIQCILFAVLNIMYRVIQNDFRGFNNLSYTIHLR